MKVTRCSGCGAELEHGPGPCPLCGEPGVEVPVRGRRKKATEEDTYRRELRALRAELRRLRDDAEAV